MDPSVVIAADPDVDACIHHADDGDRWSQYQRMNGEGGNFIEDRYGKNGILNYMLQVAQPTDDRKPDAGANRVPQDTTAMPYIERGIDGYPSKPLALHGWRDRCRIAIIWCTTRPRRWCDARLLLKSSTEDISDPTIDYFKAHLAATGDKALQDGQGTRLIQEQQSPTLGTRGRQPAGTPQDERRSLRRTWMSNDVAILDNVADAKVIQTGSTVATLGAARLQRRGTLPIDGCAKDHRLSWAMEVAELPNECHALIPCCAIPPRSVNDEGRS